ncbi:MAG: hypothetical protein ABI821_09080 [Pseudomonadota bacterium]
MKMRSPIVAMLWENWRLTRVEAAQRVALGLVAGSAALTFLDNGSFVAFVALAVLHGMFWFSIAKLNGGRLMDGYKPGFPLYLLYTRPVPTFLLVGVVMAYDALFCLVLYLASAALLGFAFGQPLPLFSAALWIVTFHLVCTCVQYATRNRIVQWVGSIAIGWPSFFLLQNRVTSALQVEFSLLENVVMILVCALSIGLTIAGVSRQRRGDAVAIEPRLAGSGGYPNWLVAIFRFPCPTSSATRAQVWFEFKSSGLPVLAIGLGVAVLISLLFALSIPFAPARTFAVGITFLSAPIMLFAFGGNAFGIRRKQSRVYGSAFEMTQAYGTAQMVGLKVLVRAGCVLVALAAIGLSVWLCSSFLSAWGEWLADGKKDVIEGLLKVRRTVGHNFGELTGLEYAALAVVAAIAVTQIVAWQATREALRVRDRILMLILQWLPAFFGFAIVLLTLALRKGFGPAPLVGEIFRISFWISGAALALATIYLLWSGFTQRALTIRYACATVAISVAFGVAWRAGLPAGDTFGIIWMALVVLMVSLLAPWALDRVRHA